MALQRVFVDVEGAARASPREPITYCLDVEAEAFVACNDLLVHLELIITHRVPFVVHNDEARGLIAQRGTKVRLLRLELVFARDADTDPVAAFGKNVLELRKQGPARVREVFESLAEELQDGIIRSLATPLKDLVERTQLVGPQA